MTDCSCKKAQEPLEGVAEPTASHEPLLGVAAPHYDVVPCGTCPTGAGSPSAIRFERFSGGKFEVLSQTDLPRLLTKTYASRTPQCLPWVRIARDPERFNACLARAHAIGPMNDPKNVFDLLGGYLAEQDQEVFLVILLDTQLNIRGVSEIARGARDGVDVPIPDVMRIVIVEGATTFVIVHNHPSGRNVNPSDADRELTKAIARAGKTNGIELLDHVIIGVGKFYSFAAHKHKFL